MVRYYFHTREDDVLVDDKEGTMLADEQSARREARRLIAQMALEAVHQQLDFLAVIVRDDDGEELFSYALDYRA
ncbi:MAG: hypothetical protein ABS75_33540 [Pelagibacterium sp. SCN 63-23]|nr:MAG: hypothetical protein ABS75_33540 [Pelagibacterium sp. SCN 63-23]